MKKAVVPLLVLIVLISAPACGQGVSSTPSVAPSPTPLPDMTPPSVRGWEGVAVGSICLEVEENFPQIEGGVGIEWRAERILSRLGLQVVASESSCDAALTVTLSGQAFSETYYPVYGGEGVTCYTGAEAEGQVVLAAEGQVPLTLPIAASHAVPETIIDRWCERHLEPGDYPFQDLYLGPLLDFLVELWGPQALVMALDLEGVFPNTVSMKLEEVGPVDEIVATLSWVLVRGEPDMREMAAMMSAEFAPEGEEAIPFLVQALNDEYRGVSGYAAQALEVFGEEAVPSLIQALEDERLRGRAATLLEGITDRYFGDDVALWQQWWEQQQ